MSRSKPDKQEVIGHWLNAPPYKGHSVMIFREAGRLYIETIFNDSTSRNELVAENTPQGTRYREKGSAHPAAGEYWIIDSNGNLQTYDIDGLISIAQKVE